MTTHKEVIGDAVLYLGDCLEVLPLLERSSVDLLLTDPPYGMNFQSGKGKHEKITNDHPDFDVTPFLVAALKTLRRGRHAYIFGPLSIGELPLCSPAELIWDKAHIGMGNLALPWAPQHERITFAVHEISKANREKGYGNLAARLRKGSILRSLRPNSGRASLHPTEKPVDILAQMIESSSVMGETVLDPFMGSGSTVVAAIMERRRTIGIELEPRYFDIACRRAEHAHRLQQLIDASPQKAQQEASDA